MTDQHTAGELPPARSWKWPTFEILLYGLASSALVVIVLGAPVRGELFGDFWALVPIAGTRALEHIGWGLGAYIPVLLSFYAIVIGGQIAQLRNAGATQRLLGTVAQLTMGALMPAILLIFAACIADPQLAGGLVVLLPVSGLAFFLAVQLGGFVVVENSMKLAHARENAAWVTGRLKKLEPRGEHTTGAGMASAAIATAVGVAFSVAAGLTSLQEMFFALLVFCAISAIITAYNLMNLRFLYGARDRVTRVALLLPMIGVHAAVAANALPLWAVGKESLAVGLLGVVSTCALLVSAPGPRAGKSWSQWTTRAGAAALAVRDLNNMRARLQREIAALEARLPAVNAPTLQQRVRAAVGALRGR
ncbi:hypothetical protein ACFSWE_12350 [Leucobacter albus]|uniref:Uncharacterized protein n=1 Tax=Leucobacter albus TaxID=272210 RepID=A0ABW3TMA9_9MICO